MKMKSTIMAITMSLALAVCIPATAQQAKSTCCDLKSDMRQLWEDHIVWTRNVILNIVDELPGTSHAVNRLLQNQVDIGNAIKPYYGQAAGNQLTTLLTAHITIAADLLTALDDGNATALNAANAAWIANANDIAAFLSAANPNWPLAEMQAMMQDHLALTTAEAVARKNADYAADVAAYDQVHVQILHMADMLTEGLTKQFPQMFRGCSGAKTTQAARLTTHGAMLEQNAPNPATGKTQIPFMIPSHVKQAQIVVYDAMGILVQRVDVRKRGEGFVELDAARLKTGLYKYSLVIDGTIADTKTMLLTD